MRVMIMAKSTPKSELKPRSPEGYRDEDLDAAIDETAIDDDLLRLIFICCHPVRVAHTRCRPLSSLVTLGPEPLTCCSSEPAAGTSVDHDSIRGRQTGRRRRIASG